MSFNKSVTDECEENVILLAYGILQNKLFESIKHESCEKDQMEVQFSSRKAGKTDAWINKEPIWGFPIRKYIYT